MNGPLEGLRVIDLSWGIVGSITGMLLADYGAEVIKVERPGGGPDADSLTRRAWDRGKASVELDVSFDDGWAALLDLLDGADVFIEALGPGRPEQLGIGYDTVHERCPQLVYCSITGYGLEGPWRDRPGYDALVAARMGQMAEQAGPREGPKFLGHASIGYGSAFTATISILAALQARRHRGAGQRVDASMLDGALAQSSMNWWFNEMDRSYLARSGTEEGFGRGRIVTDLFLCQDDEWIMVHTGGAGGFKRAMDLLGLGERIRAVEGQLEMSVPLDDDEYHVARHLVPEAFRARPRQEWVELFHAADLAALPVNRPGEVLDDEQVRFADVVIEIDDPELGTLRAAGPVIEFAGSPAAAPAPAPAVGQDNARLDELRRAPPKERAPASSSGEQPALAGVRVLDFSSFFAAGYGTKFLADLGADVIKVEPLSGDQMRPLPDPFEASCRGKRALAIDLKSAAGSAVARDLIATADVVVHNFRPGKAEKVGIGYEDVKAIKSDIVYCYMPGYGSKGPKADLKSFAPLLSGFTGLLWESAGEGAPEPARRAMGNEDYNNGFVGTIAILMGLEHRASTGKGQYIEMPQLHSSLLVTTEQMLDANGNLKAGLAMDPDQMGWSSLYRLYKTSDGWLCIVCVGEHAWQRLRSALAVTGLDDVDFGRAVARDDSAELVVKTLSDRFSQVTAEDAAALLEANAIPCEIPADAPYMPDFLWQDWALDRGLVLEHQHRDHGYVREVGFTTRLSDSPNANIGPGPLLGQHTREILGELGYDGARIEELVSSGVCIADEG